MLMSWKIDCQDLAINGQFLGIRASVAVSSWLRSLPIAAGPCLCYEKLTFVNYLNEAKLCILSFDRLQNYTVLNNVVK